MDEAAFFLDLIWLLLLKIVQCYPILFIFFEGGPIECGDGVALFKEDGKETIMEVEGYLKGESIRGGIDRRKV